MTERPILFSAPMIRALLAGTKTQTRRIVKPCPFSTIAKSDGWAWEGGAGGHGGLVSRVGTGTMSVPARCPYGTAGDRLWVREAWWHYKADYLEQAGFEGGTIALLAPGRPSAFHPNDGFNPAAHSIWRKRPSIHMPRWASRITLEITEVRAQRLHDIDDADARAEGMPPDGPIDAVINGEPGKVHFYDARTAYAHLWDTINGTGSWGSNPWIWAITFKRVEV